MAEDIQVGFITPLNWREPTPDERSKAGYAIQGRPPVSVCELERYEPDTFSAWTRLVCLYERSGKFNASWWRSLADRWDLRHPPRFQLKAGDDKSLGLRLGYALARTSWDSLEEAQKALTDEIERGRVLAIELERKEQLERERRAKAEAERKAHHDAQIASLRAKLAGHRGMMFDEYVALGLANQLPWRKKYIVAGPTVCEYAAVKAMNQSAFFAASALALADTPAAQDVAGLIWTVEQWPEYIRNFRDSARFRLDEGDGELTYEIVVGEWDTCYNHRQFHTYQSARELLEYEECLDLIGNAVRNGLAFGLALQSKAWILLSKWTRETKVWQRLNIGGLELRGPSMSSVEEAYERARALYREWSRVVQARFDNAL